MEFSFYKYKIAIYGFEFIGVTVLHTDDTAAVSDGAGFIGVFRNGKGGPVEIGRSYNNAFQGIIVFAFTGYHPSFKAQAVPGLFRLPG